jgi:hypothetical protein
MNETAWLIANGWRPSPTIRDESGWEHPRLSQIPRKAFPELYEPGTMRMPKSAAIAIMLVLQRFEEDSTRWRMTDISYAVLGTAKFLAKVMDHDHRK